MSLPVAIVAFNLEDIFHFLLDNIEIRIRYREIGATTTPAALFMSKISLLVVLVFLASLALVDGRLLVPTTRYVSKKKISGLSLSRVFFLLFCRLVPSGTLESISWVLEDDCSNIFAFALTAFSTASSQESSSRPRASNWAQMESLRVYQKYRIIISLFGVAAELNS